MTEDSNKKRKLDETTDVKNNTPAANHAETDPPMKVSKVADDGVNGKVDQDTTPVPAPAPAPIPVESTATTDTTPTTTTTTATAATTTAPAPDEAATKPSSSAAESNGLGKSSSITVKTTEAATDAIAATNAAASTSANATTTPISADTATTTATTVESTLNGTTVTPTPLASASAPAPAPASSTTTTTAPTPTTSITSTTTQSDTVATTIVQTAAVGIPQPEPTQVSQTMTTAQAQPAQQQLVPSGVPGVPTGVPSGVPTGVPTGVPSGVPGVPSGVPGASAPQAAIVATTAALAPAVQTQTPLATNIIEGVTIEKAECAIHYVGRVIGKGGEQIRDLQARSGCKIDVDQNVPTGAPRVITYQGTRRTIDFAKQLVAILCSDGGKDAQLPLGEAKKKQLQVPAMVIGKIIGRGGEMIKELQSKSQAKIQIDHSGAGGIDPSMRLVTVIGTEESVIKAEEMITFLIGNPGADAMNSIAMLVREKMQKVSAWGSGPPYVTMPNNGQGMSEMNGLSGGGSSGGGGGYNHGSNTYGGYGGGYSQQSQPQQQSQSQGYGGGGGGYGGLESEIFPCSKMYMGRVIGQKGVTINDLQKRSGCDIQINQDVPAGQDCEITIKGTRQGIDSVKRMLSDIIELGPYHPYAGGNGVKNQSGSSYGQQNNTYGQQQTYYNNQQQPQYVQQQQYGVLQQPQQQYGVLQQPQQQPIYGGAYQQQQSQPQQTYGYQQQPQQYGQQQPYVYQQPATMAVPAVMASPWKAATAPDGQTYYYNEKTGATTWEKPAGM